MRKHAKDNRPSVKPVLKAELSESNKRLRIVLIAAFLALGIFLLAFSAVKLLGTEKGYYEIEAENSAFSDFFVLNYDIGASGASASAEYRRVREVYTEALNKYCRLFSADTEYVGVKNLYYVNSHPNEEIEIDSSLYSALKKMDSEGAGQHYLGISMELYDVLFSCDIDGYALDADPKKNEEIGAINTASCEFARDREAIRLEFIDNNTVKLYVSEEYSKFAKEHGFTRYIDLGVLENAFVVDAVADSLKDAGFEYGAIASYDGYSRNLDIRDREYKYSFNAKSGDTVYPVCDVAYSGNMSTCILKTYPTSDKDVTDFYMYSNGESAHRIIDVETGKYVGALSELLLASSEKTCADLAIQAYSVMIDESFDENKLLDVSAVWLDGAFIMSSGEDIAISSPFSNDEISFFIGVM